MYYVETIIVILKDIVEIILKPIINFTIRMSYTYFIPGKMLALVQLGLIYDTFLIFHVAKLHKFDLYFLCLCSITQLPVPGIFKIDFLFPISGQQNYYKLKSRYYIASEYMWHSTKRKK